MKLGTIIIDDEAPARELIQAFLKDDDEINLLGTFQNGFEGLKAINELKPDLVILDIQMPKITGFEMLELLEHHPIIIFSTAYNEFAIKAFELNAVDYLLKPYSKQRFSEALSKAKDKKLSRQSESNEVSDLINHVKENVPGFLERVVVKTGAKIHVITIDQILYLEAQDDYVMIHSPGGKYLKQNTMKFYEEHLDPKHFVRIHRSFIVKIAEIDRLELMEKDSYCLWLKDQTKLKVSKTGYPKLKQALNF
ncbi:LytTR family DNA-binding domain-containing protein [Fulvivirgaceae bacterium BMA12]|uniref:LytTR family DNA-binding domain-containing protein n=1 Tax=Agaribacillus aureus TaxID=3051825 RepID=A0ABT8LB21_9BACT|nr:LytTR family DNA-binding domain-containing protein [Fulvivirgaceae bacterium BMA12]